MALAESEKILKDTGKKLLYDGKIRWFFKYEGQQSKFVRASAPFDFLIMTKDWVNHRIEVKEMKSSKNLPVDHFKADYQKDGVTLPGQFTLLKTLDDGSFNRTHILMRFVNPKAQKKNMKDYWERWFWAPGSYLPPERKESIGIRQLDEDLKSRDDVIEIANIYYKEKVGLEEGAGLSQRNNEVIGLTKLPIIA